MAWVRIHDGAMTNPKIEALSDSAFRLWVKALCYCQTELTDGLIPRAALRTLKPKRRDVEALTMPIDEGYAPLWETHDIGFKVHDYLFWNDSRDKVRERQQKARDRLEKWKREHEKRVAERVDNAVGNGARNGEQNTTQTKPNQTTKEQERPSDAARGRFDRFWAIYPKKVGKDAAFKAWRRRHPSEDVTNMVLAALAWQVKQDQWLAENGRYVPNPATWINQGRWQDEPAAERTSDVWACPHDPPCSGGRNDCYVKQQIAQGKAS